MRDNCLVACCSPQYKLYVLDSQVIQMGASKDKGDDDITFPNIRMITNYLKSHYVLVVLFEFVYND